MALLPIATALAGPLASLAGSFMGGRAADKGQQAANKANLKIAREQMAFQERMSSTAYQRSAKDLTAAGLNRILALGGPASSPSGALATMQSESAGKAEALKTGTASALQARIATQQFKQAQAQTGLINQTTLKEVQNTALANSRAVIEAEKAKVVQDSSFNIRSILKEFGIDTRVDEPKPYDPKSVSSKKTPGG